MRPPLIALASLTVAVVAASAALHVTGSSGAAAKSGSASGGAAAKKAAGVKPFKDVPTLRLPDPLPSRTLHVPILMYHRIAVLQGDEPQVTVGLTVDPGEFRLQMQWLHEHGYHSISQLQLYQALEQGKPLPPKPFMATFDDGYRNVATIAAPIMRAYGFTGTAYVITDRIVRNAKAAPTWLTWRQLRLLEAGGWDIGSHTVAHTEIPSLSEADAMQTLRDSRRTLERHLGHPVQWFCYPAGRVDDKSVRWVAAAGYVLATTTQEGDTLSAQDPLRLQRVRVANDTGVRGLAAILS